MGLYVNIADFQGQDKVAKDKFTTSDLDLYIDQYEVYWLRQLLGAELYDEFAVDFAITGVMPTAPKFQEIWFPFAKDNNCDVIESKGIKKMLTLLIYFEYIRDSFYVSFQDAIFATRATYLKRIISSDKQQIIFEYKNPLRSFA